jgi:hypothetical protein
MAAINPPTLSDKFALALVPGRAEAFSQMCDNHRNVIENTLIAQQATLTLPQSTLLRAQIELWSQLASASLHIPARFSLAPESRNHFLTSASVTIGSSLLFSKKITLIPALYTGIVTYALGKLAHGLLDKAHRLTTHPEQAQAILDEFVENGEEDGAVLRIIHINRI